MLWGMSLMAVATLAFRSDPRQSSSTDRLAKPVSDMAAKLGGLFAKLVDAQDWQQCSLNLKSTERIVSAGQTEFGNDFAIRPMAEFRGETTAQVPGSDPNPIALYKHSRTPDAYPARCAPKSPNIWTRV